MSAESAFSPHSALRTPQSHHSPATLTITFRVLGPSNSQKKIDCHVPNVIRPSTTGTISEDGFPDLNSPSYLS